MMGDGAHAADMQVFHQLFEHRTEITRQVSRERTASKPSLNRRTRGHTPAADARRVDAGEGEGGRPIHQRDPLFVELFKNADRIEARHELTTGGAWSSRRRRTRTWSSCTAHAEVVSVSRERYVGDDEEPSGSAALDTHDWSMYAGASTSISRQGGWSNHWRCRTDGGTADDASVGVAG